MLVLSFPRRHLKWFLVGLVSLALVLKLSMALAGAPYKLVFWSLWGCLDSLGLGALLAIVRNDSRPSIVTVLRFVQAGKIAGGIWAIMTVVRIATGIKPWYEGYLWFGVLYFAAAAITFTGLIAFAATGTKGWLGRCLENGPMVQIGRISYG